MVQLRHDEVAGRRVRVELFASHARGVVNVVEILDVPDVPFVRAPGETSLDERAHPELVGHHLHRRRAPVGYALRRDNHGAARSRVDAARRPGGLFVDCNGEGNISALLLARGS